MQTAWIKLTQPHGDPVWINAALIEKLGGKEDDCAVAIVSGHIQMVQESPQKMLDLIRAAKGDQT